MFFTRYKTFAFGKKTDYNSTESKGIWVRGLNKACTKTACDKKHVESAQKNMARMRLLFFL
jgi:hypothetical protein